MPMRASPAAPPTPPCPPCTDAAGTDAAGTAAAGAGHVRGALLRRRGWRWPPHRGRGAGRGTVTAVTRGRWERGVRRPGGRHSGGGVGGEIVGEEWDGGKEQGRRWTAHRLSSGSVFKKNVDHLRHLTLTFDCCPRGRQRGRQRWSLWICRSERWGGSGWSSRALAVWDFSVNVVSG